MVGGGLHPGPEHQDGGDVVLWANLETQHSVTPTDAYAVGGMRRLMTRTAMQPRGVVME